MKHIVGFSGGIDSQACARWVLNRFGPEDTIIVNSDAGGNEDPITTAHVEWYSRNVHPVVMLSPIVADMGGRAKGKIAELGLAPTDPLTFDLLATLKQRFPARKAQFCTEHLKLMPMLRWQSEAFGVGGIYESEDYERYAGVRRDESEKRKDAAFREWDDLFDCYLNRPIADWTKLRCFEFVHSHGEESNPLYRLGFGRVGCAPCVNSGKDDVLAWLQRRPSMIEKIRVWEQCVGRAYFPPMVPGMYINWIDDVVRWAQTSRGGRQANMLRVLNDRPTCESNYGLCE
jgi:3'-phosphoadenosine 5'-phosphosulfate sulfotransferase (PAPS reductase)/FAD synthetase